MTYYYRVDAQRRGKTLRSNIVPVTIQATEVVGPRGPRGPREIVDIPEWPGSFDTDNITDFTTLNNAVNAGGTGRKFHITGSFPFTATIVPHAADGFWFNKGVTITKGAGTFSAIEAQATNDVRVMNGTFQWGVTGSASWIVNSTNSTGWEAAYNEFDGQDLLEESTNSVKWLHHNWIHHLTSDAWSSYQLVDGIYEDNECGPTTTTVGGGGNKTVQTVRMRFRHNWMRDIASRGIWLDYKNWDAILEWNLIDRCSDQGISLEANYQSNDAFLNIVRYNTVRDCGLTAIDIQGSSHTEVYGNRFINNSLVSGAGEIDLSINQAQKDTQDAELKENWIHHNIVTTKNPSSLYASRLLVDASITDPTPYINNTKNNNWDFNTYDVPSPSGNYWRWPSADRTFAQWQALPQDVSGTAV